MENNKTLAELLQNKNIHAFCGGKGTCGKCKVIAAGSLSPITDAERKFLTADEIAGGVRLACMTYPTGEYTVKYLTANEGAMQIQTTAFNGKQYDISPLDGEYGIAVDIGTTTVAVYLCSLSKECTKEDFIIKTDAFKNPQAVYGADVISRIGYINEHEDGLDALRLSLVSEINRVIKNFGVPREKINAAAITGNTTMEHIFEGLDPKGIANAPFTPASLFGYPIPTEKSGLDIAPDAVVWLMPCFAAYVGGDIASGLIAAEVDLAAENILYIDIGTNGEIALGNKNHIEVCSTAAGPAFEGAKIEKGMPGIAGAVSKVWICDGEVKYSVIGDIKPVGICGSGLIDAVACMLQLGIIDETGMLDEKYYIDKTNDIYISPSDIRELQLAKAAISAGILTLTEISGVTIDKIIIAGGFGSYLDVRNACKIGLIPKVDGVSGDEIESLILSAGNTAGAGAALYLVSAGIRDRINRITYNSSYTELSGNMIFMDKFIEQMYFEE
jgi:uncharacterized 2Fe-2S/4Fe-4S cluster protein (DUF4445 family)